MQDNPSASPHALLDALYVLAIGIAGAIGSLVTWFINRKKVRPEISILEADAEKTRAGAEKTRAEGRKLDAETINLFCMRIDDLVAINLKLSQKIDLCEIRSRHHEAQEKRMKALLDLHGIKYSEMDNHKGDEKK
jgi:hypothetical protein